jgi:hypothetical protein
LRWIGQGHIVTELPPFTLVTLVKSERSWVLIALQPTTSSIITGSGGGGDLMIAHRVADAQVGNSHFFTDSLTPKVGFGQRTGDKRDWRHATGPTRGHRSAHRARREAVESRKSHGVAADAFWYSKVGHSRHEPTRPYETFECPTFS